MIDYKKEKHQIDTDSRNIADLCIMCGKCCLAIATEYTYEELVEMTKKDEKEAKVFVDFFKRYDSIADAKKVFPDVVDRVLQHKKVSQDAQGDEVPFYYCAKIAPDKKCTIHLDRPLCCRMAPKDGWTLMPPKCGYTGWQFEEKERIKENIRSLKEKIYEIETLEGSDAFVEELNMTLKDMKAHVDEKTKPFERYGAKGW